MGSLRRNVFRVAGPVLCLLLASTGAAAADSQLITNCPKITETGGVILAQTATECATQDNFQYNATPQEPDFPYPWDDPFYGAALMIGGVGPRPMPGPVHGGPP